MLKSFLAGTALAAGLSGFAFAQQPAAPAHPSAPDRGGHGIGSRSRGGTQPP